MVLAGGAMLVLALGYLLVALVCGRFRNRKDPAEPKLDGASEKRAQAPGGTGSGIPGRL